MLAQRINSHSSVKINQDSTVQAALAFLRQRQPVSVSRWSCEVCGMIHMGTMPLQCDSCGHETLIHQPASPSEINNHW